LHLLLRKHLESLLQELEDDPDRGLENDELASFALIAARAELAAKSIQKVDALVSWLQENFTPQQFRSPLELNLYDERIWPRSFEGEACGLVDISCLGRDPNQSSNNRQQKGQTIWEGLLKPGGSIYQRWTFINEDGFTEGEQFELPLAAEIDGGRAIELPIAVTAETFQPSWPNYSACSLHPNEVPEGELYGRGQFIKQIVNTFGPTRSTVNYLIESVRQMGKTTLLFFIKNAAPAPRPANLY